MNNLARSYSPIRHFRKTVDPGNAIRDVTPLLYELRPDWEVDRMICKRLMGGLINKTFCVHLDTDVEMSDAIVVKIYGTSGDIMVAHDREFLAMQIAHAAGCFPSVYASFENGVLYRYAHGRMMTFNDYVKPEVVRAVTRKLFLLHDVNVTSLTLWDRNGKPATFNPTLETIQKLDRLIASIPASAHDPEQESTFQQYRQALSDSVLKTERNYMKGILGKLQLPVTVTHASFNTRNMLLDERTGDVTVVDWETAAFHYRARDLAYYVFNYKVYSDLMGITTSDDPDITPEIRDLWLRSYLEALYEHRGFDPSSIQDSDLELLGIEHQILQIFGSLEFMVIGLAYVNLKVNIPIDFLKRIPVAKERYYSMKPHVPDLVAKYMKIKEKCGDSLAA